MIFGCDVKHPVGAGFKPALIRILPLQNICQVQEQFSLELGVRGRFGAQAITVERALKPPLQSIDIPQNSRFPDF